MFQELLLQGWYDKEVVLIKVNRKNGHHNVITAILQSNSNMGERLNKRYLYITYTHIYDYEAVKNCFYKIY